MSLSENPNLKQSHAVRPTKLRPGEEAGGIKLRGVIPVLLTPFLDDDSIDEGSLRDETDYAIRSGCVAVCVPGFASEHYKLSDPERYEVARIVIEQTSGRVPVFVSTGSGSVRSTVDFSRFAERAGAQGVMVVSPRGVPLGAEELLRFFEVVCRSVEIPVMLQDADFTGSGLPVGLFVQLAERCQNFLFAKLEIALPGAKCAEILRLSGDRLQVLYGLGGIGLLDGFEHGMCGIMPGPALIDLFVEIFRLHDSARTEEAKSLFYSILPYLAFSLQHIELIIDVEKRVLKRRGVFPNARLREPTLHLDVGYEKQIEKLVDIVLAAAMTLKPVGSRIE